MKTALPLLTFLFFGLIGCTSSKPLAVDNLENTRFEALQLSPGFEIYDLRIDIIRQTDETPAMDSTGTSSTDLRSYHPVGFDLGNGLFFDLNENLSLRVDRLPVIEDPESFKIKTILNRFSRRGRIYTIQPDQYCIGTEKIAGGIRENCYEIRREPDRIGLYRKARQFFEIANTDSSLVYITQVKRRKINDQIVRTTEGSYYVNNKRKRNQFLQAANELQLGSNYMIRRVADGEKLEIYRTRQHRNRLLYSLQKTADAWYVYNNRRRGQVIRQSDEAVQVLENERIKREIVILTE